MAGPKTFQRAVRFVQLTMDQRRLTTGSSLMGSKVCHTPRLGLKMVSEVDVQEKSAAERKSYRNLIFCGIGRYHIFFPLAPPEAAKKYVIF